MDLSSGTKRIGDILYETGIITKEQLDGALEEQKSTHERIGQILVSRGWLSEPQLADALSSQLKVPRVSLSRYRPMTEALRMVPQTVAERLEIIPLSILENNILRIAIADPFNVLAIDELRMLTGMDVEFCLATKTEIQREMPNFYKLMGSLRDAIVEVVDGDSGAIELDLSKTEFEASADDAPVIKLVNEIMEQAVMQSASDVHIEPFEKYTRVRYRVDGICFDSLDYPRNLHPAVSSRIKIMANMDITEKRRPQDGRILLKVLDRRVDMRVSSLPVIYGEKVVLRILDQENAMVGLPKLGFDQQDQLLIEKLITVPHGILLVTGPTGSGKSTTLYSVLEKINTPEVNVITVEDPVEYTIPGINQVQVDERAGRTFGEALRSILRQDPDKVMVGEIRDTETAQLAVRAALTGHLVLSTLHTNDAPSSVIRLVDMGIASFLVASSVVAIVAQRLVRCLCPDCREEVELPPRVCDSLKWSHGTRVFRSVGCDNCRGTGYRGRTGLFEIMMVNDEIKKLILEDAPSAMLRKVAIDSGMRSLRDVGLEKVRRGETSLEEVLNVTM